MRLKVAVVGNRYVTDESVEYGKTAIRLVHDSMARVDGQDLHTVTLVSTFSTPFETTIQRYAREELGRRVKTEIISNQTSSRLTGYVRLVHPAPKKLSKRAFMDLRTITHVISKAQVALIASNGCERGRAYFARLYCQSSFVPYIDTSTDEGFDRISNAVLDEKRKELYKARTSLFKRSQLVERAKGLMQRLIPVIDKRYPTWPALRIQMVATLAAKEYLRRPFVKIDGPIVIREQYTFSSSYTFLFGNTNNRLDVDKMELKMIITDHTSKKKEFSVDDYIK